MTMRIATTLMLGAALLAGARAQAQPSGFTPAPAVPPATRTAAAQPAATPAGAMAPTISSRASAPTPPAAAPSTPTPDGKADGAAPVQEAKNNDAGVIDAQPEAGNDTDSIVAMVNDESISDFELKQRVALYLALNGITQQLTAEQKTRIRGQ